MAKLIAVDDIPKGARLVAVDDDPPKPTVGQDLNYAIDQIPRQLGLTGRAAIEGIGDTVDFVASPMRWILNVFGADVHGGGGSYLADKIGLPKPETANERIANTGARMLVPAVGSIKAGEALSTAGGMAGRIGTQLAKAPTSQIQSAVGGGTAGQYVKENDGNGIAQFVASMAGGLAAPASFSIVQKAPGFMANATRSAIDEFAPNLIKQQLSPEISIRINQAIHNSGMRASDIPANVMNSIRADVTEAMRQGDRLNETALRRLIDYRLVGAVPGNANLTLDPVALTQQKNLAKIGANSKDATAQMLARRENENNTRIIERLNDLGASAGDRYGSAVPVIGRLNAVDDSARSVINRLYDKARSTDGRSAMLDPSAFTNMANDSLDTALLGGKLPADVRNLLNRVANGEMPLTVDVAEQFKTRIGDLQRATTDRAERLALGHVRRALDNTPLVDGQGQQAIDAFGRARRVNARYMDLVERTPALQAVRDGIEPDKFVNQYILGAGNDSSVMSVAQLRNITRGSPQATTAIRGAIMDHLKSKALNGASDEVGKVSQSALNKAIDAIGERKLNLFFSPEEVNQIRSIGRVASYEQVQPIGSAVNNSNTAGAAIGSILDRLGSSSLMSKIPLGEDLINKPAMNISIGMKSKDAANIPRGLLAPQEKQPLIPAISPALGLLGFSR